MLDPALFRQHLQATAERLKATRGLELPVAELDALESERKQLQVTTQELQASRNRLAKEIGMRKAKGENADALMAESQALPARLSAAEDQLAGLRERLMAIALRVPNIPHESVPIGSDETGNVEVRRHGTPRCFDFAVKDHVELGARHGWLDGEAGSKLSGARFTVLRGALARMHRALAQFMLDTHTGEHHYVEHNVPVLVTSETMQGTGQLPKFEDDLFEVPLGSNRHLAIDGKAKDALRSALVRNDQEDTLAILNGICADLGLQTLGRLPAALWDDLHKNDAMVSTLHRWLWKRMYLIPTAEVSLTNLVGDSILEAEALPLRLTAHSLCFRAEAGAAGRDTRGMIRQHQ